MGAVKSAYTEACELAQGKLERRLEYGMGEVYSPRLANAVLSAIRSVVEVADSWKEPKQKCLEICAILDTAEEMADEERKKT
ncbi:MAG: hypothetical protein LUD19_03025 [Clostridia bacterium]|nr:hypothetical protein [Clostridia bacterium]